MSLLNAINQSIQKSVNVAPQKVVEPVEEPKVEISEVQDSELENESKQTKESKPTETKVEKEEDKDEISEEEALEKAAKVLKKEAKKEKEPVKEQPRFEKIIEDGVEKEITIDELKKRAQKDSVSSKRFEEASKMLKEAQATEAELQDFVGFMRESPMAALHEILGDEGFNSTMEEFYQQMEAFKNMDETQKENFLLKRQLNMKETKNKFAFEREQEVLSNEKAQKIKEDLVVKFDKVCNDVNFTSNEMKGRLLRKMQAYGNQKGGGEPLDIMEIEMLADEVKLEAQGEFGGLIENMDDDQLFNFLGEKGVERVRQKLLSRFKVKKAEKVEPDPEIQTKPKIAKKLESPEDVRNFWKNPTKF